MECRCRFRKSDDQPVQHENASDTAFCRTHGFEDGDFFLLLRHDHRQGADDIEGGHDRDQDKQEKHHRLLQLQG